MEEPVRAALERLHERLLEAHREHHGTLPRQPYDAEWPSPCQVGDVDGAGWIDWRPVRRHEPADFTGLERALEVAVHPDVKALFGTSWCDSIPVTAAEGKAVLIQIWNDSDFDRLIENLIGHALAQRRRGVELTLFVACTDEDDLTLSVSNASGEVVLERPGAPPLRTVAGSLAELLERLDPVPERDMRGTAT